MRLHSEKSSLRNRRCDGLAAVEFGLMLPLLLILLTGVGEIGIAAYQMMQVQAAVEAGALYALKNGAGNLAAVATAVANGTGTRGITADPAPTSFYGCPAAAGIVSQSTDSTTPCSDGKPPGQYVQVNAKITHTTLLSYLSLPLPATLTASSTVKVK